METKFFRIAKAGKTIDGREIKPQQLAEIAQTYDPKVYGARIWIEHLRSWLPNSDFKALGDVTEVKTEVNKDGTYLLAKLKPTSEFLKLNEAKQKIYTSIEMMTDFADSGKAYLVGLAVTDSPASLGTEAIQFSKQNPQDNKSLVSEFIATDLVLEIEQKGFFSRIFNSEKDKHKKEDQSAQDSSGAVGLEDYNKLNKEEQNTNNNNNKTKGDPMETQKAEVTQNATSDKIEVESQLLQDVYSELKNLQGELVKLSDELKQAKADNSELYNKLKTTSDKQAREIADNAINSILTDC